MTDRANSLLAPVASINPASISARDDASLMASIAYLAKANIAAAANILLNCVAASIAAPLIPPLMPAINILVILNSLRYTFFSFWPRLLSIEFPILDILEIIFFPPSFPSNNIVAIDGIDSVIFLCALSATRR